MLEVDEGCLQPGNAFARERAIAEAVEEWLTLPVELLDAMWDPATVPAQALPHLCAALGVKLYRPEWSETKKRFEAADSLRKHRITGTIPGIAAYLATNDAVLVDWRAPPQGVFLGPAPSSAEMEAWYQRLPQIRVYTIPQTAPAADELYFDDGFFDDGAGPGFLLPDLAPTLSPRRATYWRDGVEVPLRTTRLVELERAQPYTTIERVEVPTPPGQSMFYDVDFYDDAINGFDDPGDHPVTVTYSLDRAFSAKLSGYATTTVVPSLQPMSVRFESVSLQEPAGDELYFDDGCYDGLAHWSGPYDGHLGFDRMCFDDPAVAAPIAPTVSFWDDSRYDMDDFRLEILVDVPGTVPVESLVYDDGFYDDVAGLSADDPGPEDAAAAAVVAGKAHRDQVLMTLATWRPRTFADGWPLDGSVAWDDVVPNTI